MLQLWIALLLPSKVINLFSPPELAPHQYSDLRFEAAVNVVWHEQQHAELLQGDELHIPLITLSHLQPLQQCVRVHVRHDSLLPNPPNTQSPCQQQERNEQGQSLVLLFSHQVFTFRRKRNKIWAWKGYLGYNSRQKHHTKDNTLQCCLGP